MLADGMFAIDHNIVRPPIIVVRRDNDFRCLSQSIHPLARRGRPAQQAQRHVHRLCEVSDLVAMLEASEEAERAA
jgi:hypothetical protein